MIVDAAMPVSFSNFFNKLICGAVPMPDLVSRAAAYESASNSSFLESQK